MCPDGKLQVQRHLYIYLSPVSRMLFMSELFKWRKKPTEKEEHQVGVIIYKRRGPSTSPVGKEEGIKLRMINGRSLMVSLELKEHGNTE